MPLATMIVVLVAFIGSLLLVVQGLLQVPVAGSVPLLVAGAAVYLWAAAAIGMLLGTVARSMAQFALLVIVVIIPVIMLSGGISVALVMIALTPVLPKIEAALADTADERLLVKLLVTVVGITMLLGAPIAGFLVARIGVKRVLMAAGLVYDLGGTAGLYLDNLVPLLASRLIVGLAGGAIAATSMTLINSTFDAAGRAKWMGSHVAVATLGGLVLHPLAGALGEWGWRLPFALYALGLAYSALAAFGLDHGAHGAQPVPSAKKSGEACMHGFPAVLRSLPC